MENGENGASGPLVETVLESGLVSAYLVTSPGKSHAKAKVNRCLKKMNFFVAFDINRKEDCKWFD